MATRMKCDNKGDVRSSGREHGQGWYKCMDALAMNKIPVPFFNYRIHLWRYTEIAGVRPGIDADNLHALAYCLTWQVSECVLWHGGQYGDIDALMDKASCHFIHMCFYPAHIREIASRDHQQTKSTGGYCSHLAMSQLFYRQPEMAILEVLPGTAEATR